MLEEIRKILFSGLGVFVMTKEKTEEMTKKLMEKTRLSKEDAARLLEELFETGSKQWSEMEGSVARLVQKKIEDLDVASKKELEDCRSKVANLEKRMAILEDQLNRIKES